MQRPDCKRPTLQRKKKSFLVDTNWIFSWFKALELRAKFKNLHSSVGTILDDSDGIREDLN